MKGATYVTVEADAAFVMPMNASGSVTTNLFSIIWTSDGIHGKGWTWNENLVVNNLEGDIGAQINAYLDGLIVDQRLSFLNYWSREGCVGEA